MRRDDVADCRRAFVTPPGRLVGIGILTDSDNTGSEVVAYDGDIRLRPAPSEDVAADTSGDTRTR